MSEQDRVFAKCAWRLIPFMGLLYLVNFIDRIFGPTLVGVLTEGTGDYAAGLVAGAIGFVLAALIVLAVGRAIAARPSVGQPAI